MPWKRFNNDVCNSFFQTSYGIKPLPSTQRINMDQPTIQRSQNNLGVLPENRPGPKGNDCIPTYSNHEFSGDMLVSGRVDLWYSFMSKCFWKVYFWIGSSCLWETTNLSLVWNSWNNRDPIFGSASKFPAFCRDARQCGCGGARTIQACKALGIFCSLPGWWSEVGSPKFGYQFLQGKFWAESFKYALSRFFKLKGWRNMADFTIL